MRKSHKVLTALAVAGIAIAGGSAFTGTGLTTTADATQFIGGQVSQAVTGATLASVVYDFTDTTTKTSVNKIDLTFTDTEDGRTVTVTPTGGTGTAFTCTVVTSNASSCTPTVPDTDYTGLSALSIAVAE